MAEKKHIVPETLAILPVRDTVLFPGAVLPLTVGRESSLALVNSLKTLKKNDHVAVGHFYGLVHFGERSKLVQVRSGRIFHPRI